MSNRITGEYTGYKIDSPGTFIITEGEFHVRVPCGQSANCPICDTEMLRVLATNVGVE